MPPAQLAPPTSTFTLPGAPSACLTTVPAPVSLEPSFLCSSTRLLSLLSFLQAALPPSIDVYISPSPESLQPSPNKRWCSFLGLLCLPARGPGLH